MPRITAPEGELTYNEDGSYDEEGMYLCFPEIRDGLSSRYLTPGQAHALADWILENVPKPEPTPLPTKFGAVVKSDGIRYTRAFKDDEPWVSAFNAAWKSDDYIRSRGFEIIYEGVDD